MTNLVLLLLFETLLYSPVFSHNQEFTISNAEDHEHQIHEKQHDKQNDQSSRDHSPRQTLHLNAKLQTSSHDCSRWENSPIPRRAIVGSK